MTGIAARLPVIAALLVLSALPSLGSDLRLPRAAEKDDSPAVRALIQQGADVNARQSDGATALHWAAHWNNIAIARALIAAGAHVDAANDYGMTPAFLAATNGSGSMMAVLLDRGANANAALPTGETVLMRAVHGGSLEVVKRLLAARAKPNTAQRSHGQTALMWAVSQQRLEIARALIENGADVHARSTSGFTPLMFAARAGSLPSSEFLLGAGDDINATAADGSTPLLVATVRGHANLAMFLLERGAAPDANLKVAGYTPLHWASSTAETPLTYGGIDAPGEWNAIPGIPDREAKLALIKSLIAHGADIEARITKMMFTVVYAEMRSRPGGTPFLTAAASGDAGVMRLLLALGANPEARSDDGSTALMLAAGAMGQTVPNADHAIRVTEADRIEACKLALAVGNDLEAVDTRGYRAMHVAASAGFHQIITWLLSKGADLNPKSYARTERGIVFQPQTPLGVAEGFANFIRPATAEFLRKLGAQSEGKVTLKSYVKEDADGVEANQAKPPAVR